MAVLTPQGRREPMEQGEELSSSSSPVRQCRICHEEEEERCAAMESPCTCSGSLKYAHRGCVQRWCDEKGSTICEICLQVLFCGDGMYYYLRPKNFEPGYTIHPKKAPVVEMQVTVSDDDDEEEAVLEHHVMERVGGDSDGAECSWCRSLAITFTLILLVWHLIAVVTIQPSEHCAFSVVAVFVLRAAGILLPFYAVVKVIRAVQHGRRQRPLPLLQENRRRNASNLHQEVVTSVQ